MKNGYLGVFCVIGLLGEFFSCSGIVHGQETVFVTQYITDAERTPLNMDETHALEGVSWDLPEDSVTDKGLQTIKNAAEEFKNDYVGSLLDKNYEPTDIYTRAQYETVPFTDAASFLMTVYPDTADGADIMLGFTALDASSMPISQDDLQSIRQRLSLGLPTAQKSNIDIYPGNPDLMFVAHVFENFPGWRDSLQ